MAIVFLVIEMLAIKIISFRSLNILQGSHWDRKTWKMGRHVPVRGSQGILSILKSGNHDFNTTVVVTKGKKSHLNMSVHLIKSLAVCSPLIRVMCWWQGKKTGLYWMEFFYRITVLDSIMEIATHTCKTVYLCHCNENINISTFDIN